MPTITTLADVNRKRRQQQQSINEIKTFERAADVRASYYALPQWKSLRKEYRRLHPLDELSLLSDVIEAAEDVHHLISPFEYGHNAAEITLLLLDADNLISLTKLHHGYIHANRAALSDMEKDYLNERISAVKSKYQ